MAEMGFAVGNYTLPQCTTVDPLPTLIQNDASTLYWQCINDTHVNMKQDLTLVECYKGLAGWRWPVYLMTIYVPMAFVIVEFFLNRIEIPSRFIFA